jgi:hypothetical protein
MSSISESCPEIKDIRVRVFSMRGSLIPGDPFREFRLSAPEYVECRNPNCKGGRFRIWPVITVAASRREPTFRGGGVCNGYEGRRKGEIPCLYTFTIEGEIIYKSNEPNA